MTTENTIFIGIDWADKEHVFHLIVDGKKPITGSFKQETEEIQQLIDGWRKRFPECTFAISIETSKGPLINALINHADVIIYPINPAALAHYRKAFAHGGGKNDPSDAKLLAKFLRDHHEDLKPLRRDDPITRELGALSEDRRRLVDQRTAVSNELKAVLKRYYPAILELDPAKIYADFILRLVLKYSTLAAAQKAGKARLRRFFMGLGSSEKIETRLELLMTAKPLTTDETVLRVDSRRAVALCQLLVTFNKQIDEYDKAIKDLVVQHQDYKIFKSLPAGSYATQARMIAAMGDDRSRYESAEALQAASGIAPLTTQSGQQRFTSSRWACTKFMKQTFHEFAGLTIMRCKWAKAYYKMQIARGKSTQMAIRALAYKWQRILFSCWQSRTAYSDEHYMNRLRANGSPLLAFLED